MLLKSRTGETQHIDHWKEHLNSFWNEFDRSRREGRYGPKLPQKPVDAWERYVKIMGLVQIS